MSDIIKTYYNIEYYEFDRCYHLFEVNINKTKQNVSFNEVAKLCNHEQIKKLFDYGKQIEHDDYKIK